MLEHLFDGGEGLQRLRLLLGSLADAPPRVQERMLETIPTTPLSLQVSQGFGKVPQRAAMMPVTWVP